MPISAEFSFVGGTNFAIRDPRGIQATLSIFNTTETVIVPAQGAGFYSDITKVIIHNSDVTPHTLVFRDSVAGSPVFVVSVAPGTTEHIRIDGGITQANPNQAWTVKSAFTPALFTVTVFVKALRVRM